MATYARPMLTDDDLAAMSGRTSPRVQRRWLDKNGIRYLLDQDGRPHTTWGAVEAVMLASDQHRRPGVDLDKVK